MKVGDIDEGATGPLVCAYSCRSGNTTFIVYKPIPGPRTREQQERYDTEQAQRNAKELA